MSSVLERDETVLKNAGMTLKELASATADFVRHQPLYRIRVIGNALTTGEEAFLKRAGAKGLGEDTCMEEYKMVLKKSALEYGKMVASSLTSAQAAEHLGVSTSRIRQRTDAKTLYSVNTPKGRVYPSWQFSEKGGTVPGLEEVFPLLRDDAHPIGIQRFFLTPQNDLEDTIQDKLILFNPINWLATGHSVTNVKKLAEFI